MVDFVEVDLREVGGNLVVDHGPMVGMNGFWGTPMGAFVVKLFYDRRDLGKPIKAEDYFNAFGRSFHFWIDIKDRNIETKVVDLLKKHDIRCPLFASSGYYDSLKQLKKIAPEIATFLGNVTYRPVDPVSLIKSADADGISIHHTFVDGDLINAVHKGGLQVAVWTVNTRKDYQRVCEIGVDIVLSDKYKLFNAARATTNSS